MNNDIIRRRITAIMDEMLKLTKDLHRMKINPHQVSDREVAALVKRITEKAYGGA